MKDAYKILGVNEFDSEKDIKKSYIKLCKKYHPDLCSQESKNLKIIKKINAAFEIIIKEKNKLENIKFSSSNLYKKNKIFTSILEDFFVKNLNN